MSTGTGTEKEYTFREIADELDVSHSTVRNLFRREPDVHRVGVPGSKRPAYRVPAHVYERVKRRISNPPLTPRR
jgi:predicted transcriptional regulator